MLNTWQPLLGVLDAGTPGRVAGEEKEAQGRPSPFRLAQPVGKGEGCLPSSLAKELPAVTAAAVGTANCMECLPCIRHHSK